MRLDAKPVTELAGQRAAPPNELTATCTKPVELKAGALSAGAVERLWAADRTELAVCKLKHKSVVDFYRNRDAALAGESNPN